MKARVRVQEAAFVYGVDPESKKAAALKAEFENMGIPFAFLSAECWDKTVGFCVGASGAQEFGQAPVPRQEREVFLMKEFSAARREQVLADFREGRLPKIELKAIVTPHNQTWTLGELITELGKEHACMQAYQELRRLAAKAQTAGEPAASLTQPLERAQELLRSKTPQPEEVYRAAAEKLRAAMGK